jgi:signal transduction histidine kinase
VSLRLRLLVAVGAIAVIALVLADFATYSALRSSLYKQDDQSLAQSAFRVGRFVNSGGTCPTASSSFFGPGGGTGASPPAGGGGGGGGDGDGHSANAFGNIPFIEVLTSSGAVVNGRTCPAYVGTTKYTPQLPAHITGFSSQAGSPPTAYFSASSTQSGGPAFRVQVTKVRLKNLQTDQEINALGVVAEPIGATTNTLHTLLLIELAVTAGALVLALAGGWWLVRLGLRPLEDVERTAESIAAGNLDQRVPGADEPTEVGRLARALNVMLERIEAAFRARVASEARLQESDRHLRQFVADASHELRTPIAAVSAYAELFERGAAQHADDLPRVFTGIRSETARMERLVNDLLTLARFDEGLPLQIVPTELVGLTADAVHTAGTVGPQWPVQFTASHPVEVMGDPTRLRQVIDNLLANVRAHTPEGTATTVHVGQDGNTAEIVVKDAGPGMPTDEAARVFERFYRVDASRARGHGGSGLGLSIVAAIVAAHGGTVSASSAVDQGMTVTVRIPVIAEVVEPEAAGVPDGAGVPDSVDSVGGPSGGVDPPNGIAGSNGAGGKDQVRAENGTGGAEVRPDRMTGTHQP